MMPRKIKFRGWNGQKMLEPQDLSQYSKYWSWLGKQDVQLMQYTGLKDKNGKEIYERDIVRCGDNPMAVSFEEWSAEGYYGVMAWTIGDETSFQQQDAAKYEIIGNIYENPELLK